MRAKKTSKSIGLRQAQDRLLKEALGKLPERASVDALLISPAQQPGGEDVGSLPPIVQEGAGAPGTSVHVPLHGRRKSRSSASHPLDTNGFRACLRLPPLVNELASEGSDEDRSRCPKEWHVLLLPDRLEDASDPSAAAAAAQSVASELQTTQEDAEALVETACQGLQALLATCRARVEALRKATALRDRGLSVRVTSRPFADASAGGFTTRMQKLAGLCGGSMRDDLFRLANSVRRLEARPSAEPGAADWRRTTDMNLQIAPEDPVEALFDLERRQKAQQLTDRGPKEPAVAPGTRFRRVVTGAMISGTLPPAEEQSSSSRDAQGDLHAGGAKTARTTNERSSPDTWNIAPVKASLPKGKLSPIWKEACRLMRTFVFGKASDEAADEDDTYQETIGSREEVYALFGLWERLDTDHSGRVSIEEFRTFSRHHAKTLQGMTEDGAGGVNGLEDFAQRLCEKVEKLLLEKKSSFCIEDVMRLIWPAALRPQLRQMKQWTVEFAHAEQRVRVRPPPVLPREELEGLCTIFKQFDRSQRGYLLFADLVELGVIHKYHLDRYQQEWDRNGNGHLDLLEFCDMMCPAGYRAHTHAMVGSFQDGRRVLYDTVLQMWRLEDGADELDRGWL